MLVILPLVASIRPLFEKNQSLPGTAFRIRSLIVPSLASSSIFFHIGATSRRVT
jgi:hypothetical protein